MNVAICSLFRDSASGPELARYQWQMSQLAWPREETRVFALEGDSVDHTWDELTGWALDDERIFPMQRHQGTRAPRSVEDATRLVALSELMTLCISETLADDWADAVLWVESDLIWTPDLIERLARHRADAVAPWVYIQTKARGNTDPGYLVGMGTDGRVFYDTWAFRHVNDKRFSPHERPPVNRHAFPVSSAGSCLLMTREAAEAAMTPRDMAIVGSCWSIRDAGMTVLVDPSTVIWHPWPRGN